VRYKNFILILQCDDDSSLLYLAHFSHSHIFMLISAQKKNSTKWPLRLMEILSWGVREMKWQSTLEPVLRPYEKAISRKNKTTSSYQILTIYPINVYECDEINWVTSREFCVKSTRHLPGIIKTTTKHDNRRRATAQ
jgi:hypothetical protein